MSTSPILGIQLVAPTQNDKTTTINDAILQLEGAANAQLRLDFSGGNVTLTVAEYTNNNVFNCESLAANDTLVVPSSQRVFGVRNSGTTYSVTIGGATGATVVLGGRVP